MPGEDAAGALPCPEKRIGLRNVLHASQTLSSELPLRLMSECLKSLRSLLPRAYTTILLSKSPKSKS